MTSTARTRAKTTLFSPPNWLTRPEKLIYKRIVLERSAAGLPFSAIVADAVADYAMSRSRVRNLKKMLADAQAEVSELEADRAFVLALFRELDRATRLSAAFAGRLESGAA